MQNYYNKQVLITGGLGFIGSNLARKLITLGANVTLVDSLIPEYGGNVFNIDGLQGKLSYHICDMRDKYAIAHLIQKKDYLFNLAGQTSHLDSMIDPLTDLEINAQAQLSILEACRAVNKDIRIVFASTRQIYGKPECLPVSERHPIRPVDVNGINKFAGESYHLLYSEVYQIPSSVLRLTNTYGPRMRIKDARQTFLGIWIKQLLNGEPIQIYGDGKQIRDFNYVDDCVEAMLIVGASEKSVGKVYNLGDSNTYSLKDVANKMISIHGSGSLKYIEFPTDRKKIDIGDYYSDYSLIASEMGWRPQIGLEQGIAATIAYYRENIDKYIESYK